MIITPKQIEQFRQDNPDELVGANELSYVRNAETVFKHRYFEHSTHTERLYVLDEYWWTDGRGAFTELFMRQTTTGSSLLRFWAKQWASEQGAAYVEGREKSLLSILTGEVDGNTAIPEDAHWYVCPSLRCLLLGMGATRILPHTFRMLRVEKDGGVVGVFIGLDKPIDAEYVATDKKEIQEAIHHSPKIRFPTTVMSCNA